MIQAGFLLLVSREMEGTAYIILEDTLNVDKLTYACGDETGECCAIQPRPDTPRKLNAQASAAREAHRDCDSPAGAVPLQNHADDGLHRRPVDNNIPPALLEADGGCMGSQMTHLLVLVGVGAAR